MLGYILLLISIILYFSKQYKYISYFIYISFMSGVYGGFNLWTDQILGTSNTDLAVVYTFLINFHLLISKQFKIPKQINFIIWYKILIIFIIFTTLFSIIHYNFSLYQVVQGGRDYFLLLSLPIILQIKLVEIKKLLKLFLFITLLTSILYILQVIIGKPIMPYPFEPSFDSSTGLIRLFNTPPMLDFFLLLSFTIPTLFPKKINLYRTIFILALILTLGRTLIISIFMCIFLALYFNGKSTKLIKTLLIISLIMTPLIDIISARLEGGDTGSDLQSIISGEFINDAKMGYNTSGTFSYRIAWVYERILFLINRPLGEQIFGLGFISEATQSIVDKMYDFQIGLINPETKRIMQLSTPDIAYGNLISKLGICGCIIYLIFTLKITLFFYKKRKQNAIYSVFAALMISMLIISLSCNTLSEPKNFSLYFLGIAYYINTKKITCINHFKKQ